MRIGRRGRLVSSREVLHCLAVWPVFVRIEAWRVSASSVSCVPAVRFVVQGVLWYTTKPPKYHRKSLYFVKNCTVCTNCNIEPNPFHNNGFELKTLVYSGVFPSWTSRVQIPAWFKLG